MDIILSLSLTGLAGIELLWYMVHIRRVIYMTVRQNHHLSVGCMQKATILLISLLLILTFPVHGTI